MKLIPFFLLLIFFVPAAAMAQANEPTSSDPKSVAILDKVAAKYEGFSTIETTFSLKIEGPEGDINEDQGGTLWMKGDQFRLDMGQQEVFCDNATIWIFLKDANEVQVNNYEPDPQTITPAQIYTIYKTGFISLLVEEKTIAGKMMSIIDLTPVDKEKPYFKIRMVIDKAANTIQQAKIFDKNGNRYTYEVKKFTPNAPLADSFFTFNKADHPGCEETDLRDF